MYLLRYTVDTFIAGICFAANLCVFHLWSAPHEVKRDYTSDFLQCTRTDKIVLPKVLQNFEAPKLSFGPGNLTIINVFSLTYNTGRDQRVPSFDFFSAL